MRTQRSLLLLLLAAAFVCAGCNIHTAPAGPMQHESRKVERDASTSLRAELRMGAGSLKVRGDSPGWLQADFNYNVPQWKPDIRYSTAGGQGDLLVEQPDSKGMSFSNTTNNWDLRLNNEAATDLVVKLGAGEASLNLGALALRSLKVEMGAGQLNLDLRGKPSHDYDVKLEGGAGEATVHLPRDAGIFAKVQGGLGSIDVRGLHKEDDHWINDAYATAKVKIHLDFQGGVGSISLIAE